MGSIEIIPAVIPNSFETIARIAKQVSGSVSVMQIDVVDGRFTPSVSWPYTGEGLKNFLDQGKRLPLYAGLSYEIDLMIERPEEVMDLWLALGVKRIIVHIESTKEMRSILKMIRESGSDTEIGIALGLDTSVNEVVPYLEDIDFVQCMGIARIGYQGEAFDDRVVEQINLLRKHRSELIISVDGGVSLGTAEKLLNAGARRLVSGSALLHSGNFEKTLAQFKTIGETYA